MMLTTRVRSVYEVGIEGETKSPLLGNLRAIEGNLSQRTEPTVQTELNSKLNQCTSLAISCILLVSVETMHLQESVLLTSITTDSP